MKEIKCDYCNTTLSKNTPRIKSTVEKLSSEVRISPRSIVNDDMNFCNVHCLSNLILYLEREN